MDRYKRFFGKTWCATTDIREIDPKILSAVQSVTGLSDSEGVLLYAYVDSWALRDQVYVILTNQRVIAGVGYRRVKQALIKDVKQLERKPATIKVHSAHEDFDLFVAPFWPKPELADRLFQVANQIWLGQRTPS